MSVFYVETMSIVEIVIEASVEVICTTQRDNKLLGDNWKAQHASIIHSMATEATRKIDDLFTQLSSPLLKENKMLRARLKGETEKVEAATRWRENVLKGYPVLFEDTGLVFQLKPLGMLQGNPPLTKVLPTVLPTVVPRTAVPPTVVPTAAGVPPVQHNGRITEEKKVVNPAARTSVSKRENEEFEVNSETNSMTSLGGESASLDGGLDDMGDTSIRPESRETDGQTAQTTSSTKKPKCFVCEVCDKSFRGQSYLKQHMNIHDEQRRFACDQCPRRFKKTNTFERHLLSHEEKKLEEKKPASVKCPLCEKVFKSKMLLKSHQLVHTDARPFKCLTCGKGFKTKRCLKIHQGVHSVEKPHKCIQCGEGFKYAFSLKCHKSVHTGELPYKCTVCGKDFGARKSLQSHQRVHSGKAFTCEVCGASFTLGNNLRRHMRFHTGERPYKCKVCDESFMQGEKLKSHMLLHGASKPFMCDLCGKTFLYNCALKKHMQSQHEDGDGHVVIDRRSTYAQRGKHARERGNRRVIYRKDRTIVDVTQFSCKICRRGFHAASILERHEQRHHSTGPKQYTCGECGKSFFYKNTYDYHQRIHSGERPFECGMCLKTFITQQSLKSHKLLHSGERPHKCEHCGKTFRFYTNFIRHLRIHTGEKPYECEVCGMRFNQMVHVKSHMQIHTGDKLYSCAGCGRGFSDSRQLKKHSCSNY